MPKRLRNLLECDSLALGAVLHILLRVIRARSCASAAAALVVAIGAVMLMGPVGELS